MKTFISLLFFSGVLISCSDDQQAKTPSRPSSGDQSATATASVPSDNKASAGSTTPVEVKKETKNPYATQETATTSPPSSSAGNTSTDPTPTNPAPTTPSVEMIELYENYNAQTVDIDYMSDTKRTDLGYFRVFKVSNNTDTIALYRCYSEAGTNHFMSVDEKCESTQYKNLGAVGYIYKPEFAEKGIAVKRCFNSSKFDHGLADVNGNCPQGYAAEGILGYYPKKE